MIFRGYISKLKSGSYFNMKIITEKETYFLPVKFKIKDDTLIVKFPSSVKFKTLIKKQVIEGKMLNKDVSTGQISTTPVVTSNSKQLEKVFNQLNESELFGKNEHSFLVFKRNKR